MIEHVHRFGGGDGRLCGILTLPDADDNANRLPAVLFLSAGLLHKPGPYRLHVELARALAAMGFACLRFDLSGIGDSARAPNGAAADAIAVADTRAAMDFIAGKCGCERFVLFGLCSGAEVAQHTAVVDARVAGLVLLDGHLPLTPAYYLWHYLPRLLSVRKWASFIGNRIGGLWRAHRPGDSPDAGAANIWREHPPARDQLAAELRLLCERDVRQLHVFSGGAGNCSYAGQFRDAYRNIDFDRTATVRYLPAADHMYILRTDRRVLHGIVSDWMAAHWCNAAEISMQPAVPDRQVAPGAAARKQISAANMTRL